MLTTTEVGGRPLATLHELQTIYSTTDLYDLIELLDVNQTLLEQHSREMERQMQMTK